MNAQETKAAYVAKNESQKFETELGAAHALWSDWHEVCIVADKPSTMLFTENGTDLTPYGEAVRDTFAQMFPELIFVGVKTYIIDPQTITFCFPEEKFTAIF